MTGLTPCSACVYLGSSSKDSTKICRRRAPFAQVMQQAAHMDYIPATWPAVDDQTDGCGEGLTGDELALAEEQAPGIFKALGAIGVGVS